MPLYYSNTILEKELKKLNIFYSLSAYNYIIVDEINYKKQAYDIAISLGDEKKVQIYKSQLERSD